MFVSKRLPDGTTVTYDLELVEERIEELTKIFNDAVNKYSWEKVELDKGGKRKRARRIRKIFKRITS